MKGRFVHVFLASLFLLAVVSAPLLAGLSANTRFNVQILPDVPGQRTDLNSRVAAINSAGRIVGDAYVSEAGGAFDHAIYYDGVAMQDVGAAFFPGRTSRAGDMNNLGDMVLWAVNYNICYLYHPGQQPTLITASGLPWDQYPAVNCINDSGAMAGCYYYYGLYGWPIGLLGPGYDINNAGVVVGTTTNMAYSDAFVGDQNIAGLVEGPYREGSAALKINESGQVVGYSWDALDGTHTTGWLYDMNTGTATFLSFTPSGINNAGTMIGSSLGGLPYGCIADSNGAYLMHDLINLPTGVEDLYNMTAQAINDSMQVAGSCYYYVDGIGRWGAYLATPVPEPSCLLALGSGLLALCGVIGRRK